MSNENGEHAKSQDNSAEGDKNVASTSAKVAGESVTAETQATRYEQKFTSFSSSRQDESAAVDDPVRALMNRVNSHRGDARHAQSAGSAVSEFILEDMEKGIQVTARGNRTIGEKTTADPPPRQSFLDGLKAVFDRAKSPEEAASLQSAFSIEYIMRKAKEALGGLFQPVAQDQAPQDPKEAGAAAASGAMRSIRIGLQERIDQKVVTSVCQAQMQHGYAGEPIFANQHVPTGSYQAGTGETLVSIAQKHLGVGSTNAEQEAYAREIQMVNGLKGGKEAPPHQQLVLPGHDCWPDGKGGTFGALIIRDGAREIQTFKDGAQIIKNSRTERYFQPMAAADHNGTIEYHHGNGASDEFFVRHTKDGQYHYYEKEGGKEHHASTDAGVKAAHAKLHELAEKKIPDYVDRSKFEADMVRFEERARQRGLSNQEILETYKQIGRLFEAPHPAAGDKTRHAPPERWSQLAQEVLSQAASPRTISQGHFNTCNVTAVETLIYTNSPSKAAKLVADVALTGSYTAHRENGTATTSVTLDKQSLLPHDESKTPYDGNRTFATQIFNVTAVNLVYKEEGSGIVYKQEPPIRKDPKDNGERLYDKAGTKIDTSPGLEDSQIVRAHQLISGKEGRCVMLDHKDWVCGDASRVDTIKDERDLNQKLDALKKSGGLPVIVGIHTALEPFFTDSGGQTAPGSAGPHVVTITDYRAGPPAMVEIDNQWTDSADHRGTTVAVTDLYLSMRPPDQCVDDVQRNVQSQKDGHHIDKEIDLARVQFFAGKIDESTFGWEVARRMDEANKRWEQQKKDHTFNKAEYDRTQAKLRQLRSTWPPDCERAYREGNINDTERALRSAGRTAGRTIETATQVVNGLAAVIFGRRKDH